MEYIKYKLLNESVRFIETCQICALKGVINRETYSSLVNIKLEFLRNMLKYDKLKFCLDRKFSSRLEGIFKTDNILLDHRGGCNGV